MEDQEDPVKVFLHKELTETIIRCAITVHTELGPGLLEALYEEALSFELQEAGLLFQRQVEMPVYYKGIPLNGCYRADLVVENSVVVELKSVTQSSPVFEAQLLTYMRLGGWRVGLLINFGMETLRRGLTRLAF